MQAQYLTVLPLITFCVFRETKYFILFRIFRRFLHKISILESLTNLVHHVPLTKFRQKLSLFSVVMILQLLQEREEDEFSKVSHYEAEFEYGMK